MIFQQSERDHHIVPNRYYFEYNEKFWEQIIDLFLILRKFSTFSECLHIITHSNENLPTLTIIL